MRRRVVLDEYRCARPLEQHAQYPRVRKLSAHLLASWAALRCARAVRTAAPAHLAQEYERRRAAEAQRGGHRAVARNPRAGRFSRANRPPGMAMHRHSWPIRSGACTSDTALHWRHRAVGCDEHCAFRRDASTRRCSAPYPMAQHRKSALRARVVVGSHSASAKQEILSRRQKREVCCFSASARPVQSGLVEVSFVLSPRS
jgi:hypothetical protein